MITDEVTDDQFKQSVVELWKKGDLFFLDSEKIFQFVQELTKEINKEDICKKLSISVATFEYWLDGDEFMKEHDMIVDYFQQIIAEFQLNVIFTIHQKLKDLYQISVPKKMFMHILAILSYNLEIIFDCESILRFFSAEKLILKKKPRLVEDLDFLEMVPTEEYQIHVAFRFTNKYQKELEENISQEAENAICSSYKEYYNQQKKNWKVKNSFFVVAKRKNISGVSENLSLDCIQTKDGKLVLRREFFPIIITFSGFKWEVFEKFIFEKLEDKDFFVSTEDGFSIKTAPGVFTREFARNYAKVWEYLGIEENQEITIKSVSKINRGLSWESVCNKNPKFEKLKFYFFLS